MDTKYLLKREQVSLALAQNAATIEARHAHGKLAKVYGDLLAASTFPHRQFLTAAALYRQSCLTSELTPSRRALARWSDDGGREPRSKR